MQNQYIVRTDDNSIISFLYNAKFGISMKVFSNGQWHKSNVIIKDVRELYTVNLCENKDIYLFCQSISGDIILCRKDNNQNSWSQKIILKNNAKFVQNIIFNCITTKLGMNIIYNIPADGKNTYFLMSQKLDSNGKWHEAIKIDKISGFYNGIFQFQMHTGNHALIFYKKADTKNCIGYREINSEKVGEFNNIYSSNFPFGDCTFLTAKESIHFLYTVKNVFSSKIIYRKKDATGLKEATVIAEGQQINNCILMIVKNRLYAFWCNSEKLFYSYSDDEGNSFSKPEKYRSKFCLNPQKANYLSFEKINEDKFLLKNLFTDSNNPCDIQIIPDLYSNFYKEISQKKNINSNVNSNVNLNSSNSLDNVFSQKIDTNIRENIKIKPEIEYDNTPIQSYGVYNPFGQSMDTNSNNSQKYNQNDLNEQIRVFKNKIQNDKINIDFKDNQIKKLMSSIQKKNQEIAEIDNNWQKKYHELIEENKRLKNTIENINQNKQDNENNNKVEHKLPAETEINKNAEDNLYNENILNNDNKENINDEEN